MTFARSPTESPRYSRITLKMFFIYRGLERRRVYTVWTRLLFEKVLFWFLYGVVNQQAYSFGYTMQRKFIIEIHDMDIMHVF